MLNDFGEGRERDGGAGEEDKWEPEKLVEDLSFLHGVGDAGDHQAEGGEGNGAGGDEDDDGQDVAEAMYVKENFGKKHFDEHGGEGEEIIGDDAGGQHVGRGDGSDVEATENALFAEKDESGAESPEAAHDGEAHDRAEKIADTLRIALSEDAGVKEEKAEGHNHAEKEKHFVAQGELNAHAGEG